MSGLKTEILEASIEFLPQPFIKPLQLSSGEIRQITEARATVRVRVDGREAAGRGAIYLSDLWAWPDPALTHEARDAVLRALCEQLARNLQSLCGEPAHPLELGIRLHHHIVHEPDEFEHLPMLARAMCASPFDAAIHDAAGQALERSAFDFYDEPVEMPLVDSLFRGGNAAAAIRSALRSPVAGSPATGSPAAELDAWLVVGARDTAKDLAPWIQERGYHCFKLKLLGRETAADVARTAAVFDMARELGAASPRLSVDSNEANPDAASVLEYLETLQSGHPAVFAALEYLEQPTGRDITRHAFDWRPVTSFKPVLLDEGLTSLELLETAVAQGWSGLALKTCKGHSFTLVAAAWARERGMLLAMQDLTNPGLAAIHSALVAAHLGTINGIELNSPQYTPAANAAWLPRLTRLFEVQRGTHVLDSPRPAGLGSAL